MKMSSVSQNRLNNEAIVFFVVVVLYWFFFNEKNTILLESKFKHYSYQYKGNKVASSITWMPKIHSVTRFYKEAAASFV